MAQTEAYKVFGIDLFRENLVSMENGIEKLKEHCNFCSKLNHTLERSTCFYKLKDYLERAKGDFLWNISPDISKEEKPNFGTMYL